MQLILLIRKLMRLSDLEINGIKLVCSQWNNGNKLEIYLFGSRVDPNQKGGDIDLVWIVGNKGLKDYNKLNSYKILARIKQLIGDQRIDLKIITKEDLGNPFYVLIADQMIRL